MRSQDNVRPTFTVIYHDKRIELGLNLLEYILADTIFYLSQNSKGYCYKSIRSMARDLGMSFHGVHEALNRLIIKELLLKVEGGFKCADSFVEAVYLKRDPKWITQSKDRSKMDQLDPKRIAGDPKVAPQQMLDIHKNNNRIGTPRDIPRVPQEEKLPNPKALELQKRIKRIYS